LVTAKLTGTLVSTDERMLHLKLLKDTGF